MHLMQCDLIKVRLMMSMTTIRRYSELRQLLTFEERFNYLKLGGIIGESTFGFDRYLNQFFYRSSEWKKVRNKVILRDEGCDMGMLDYPVNHIIVHHMNPITVEMIEDRDDILFDPEYLICVSHDTHNAIHFGDKGLLPKLLVERKPNDMCPWR
jgi:hypothetical protein